MPAIIGDATYILRRLMAGEEVPPQQEDAPGDAGAGAAAVSATSTGTEAAPAGGGGDGGETSKGQEMLNGAANLAKDLASKIPCKCCIGSKIYVVLVFD